MKKSVLDQLRALALEILEDTEGKNLAELKTKTAALYDKLAVLAHLEQSVTPMDSPSPQVKESLDSKSYREQNWFNDPKPVEKPEHQDELTEPLIEKIKDIVAQMPQETAAVDALLKEVIPEKPPVKNDMEDIGVDYANMPVFERKYEEVLEPTLLQKQEDSTPKSKNEAVAKPKSVNESAHKKTPLGLNDRLAFIKHLFNDSPEDFARVMSQIDGMASFDQAEAFILQKIKPEYNYWLGKDEYVTRFYTLLEKRF